MSYEPEDITRIRFAVFQQLKQEMQQAQGNANIADSLVPLNLVEMRVQTIVMAGIGQGAEERKTSPEVATLATQYMDDPNPEVRRMAASLISQA